MPKTIRQTLGDRLSRHPAMARTLEDLRLATGLPVQFVSGLGHRPLGEESCRLCRHLHAHPQGERFCNRHLQGLLEVAHEAPGRSRCDAGLYEAAVPLRIGGQTVGWLVTGHSVPRVPTKGDVNQARHLLERAGVTLPAEDLARLLEAAPVRSPERLDAIVRLVATLAEMLVREISETLARPPEKIPALIERACRYVRGQFAHPLTLADCARSLGVSCGHLSRSFHQSTGLRFVEYVARVRADHARQLLLQTEDSITEIAFACGFQSLSQYHRTMRSLFGCSPGELRRKDRLREPSVAG